MNKSKLITLLTTTLALGSATATQTDALSTWVEKNVPPFLEAAKALATPPFYPSEPKVLAEKAVIAAQELKGVFAGAERAKIAQTVFIYAIKDVTPDNLEPYFVPLLESDQVAALIESAFQRVFGSKTEPVVDAQDVEEGSIQ